MSAQLIKELRETTGAGMLDCKKALDASQGNMQAAIDWLRNKGLASAAKKSGRVAAEGLVAVAGGGKKAAMIELNSETDFVARNEQFQNIATAIAGYAVETDGNIDRLKAHQCSIFKKPVADAVAEAIATIGENIQLRRSAALSVGNGTVSTYVHGAVKPGMGKIGVLVALESAGDAAKLDMLGKQLAMHIAASNPTYIETSEIPASARTREEALAKAKAEKLWKEFVAFETGMAKYKDKLGKERNFSEKQFEPKLKELAQTLPNVDELLSDFDTKSVSDDRKEKQDAEKTKKLLAVFFEEAAFLLKKMRSYGDETAIRAKLAQLYLDEALRDAVLFEQIFVIDGKTKIADVIAGASKDVGADVKLAGFVRFGIGDGIEKAEDEFAAEVAKAAGVA